MYCKFIKLNEKAIEPRYGSSYAAGADLYSVENVRVPMGETVFVHTGIAIEPDRDCVILLFARSSLACKKGLCLANGVGVVDYDYRGEIIVALHNDGSHGDQHVSAGDRIAQMMFTPYMQAAFVEAENLNGTARGAGGFGSTGK